MPTIYGINPLLEQLAADPARVERIYLRKGPMKGALGRIARLARVAGVALTYVERKALDRLAGGAGAAHQGAVAEVGEFDYMPLKELLDDASRPARLLLLDGVQDPRNLGSIVRTTGCAGADGIVIPKRNSAGMTAAAIKTSAGAAASARIARVANLARVLVELKQRNIWCVAIDAKGEQEVGSLDPALDYAFVFGGEGKGIRRLLRERCDFTARIPMHGPLDSLNVAVAVGVTLYVLLPD